jgi:hypothetical protein
MTDTNKQNEYINHLAQQIVELVKNHEPRDQQTISGALDQAKQKLMQGGMRGGESQQPTSSR